MGLQPLECIKKFNFYYKLPMGKGDALILVMKNQSGLKLNKIPYCLH